MFCNVWLKLGIYAVLECVGQNPGTLAVHRFRPNQAMDKQKGASAPAKGGRLALASMLPTVFHFDIR